jgi:hypothetical protein
MISGSRGDDPVVRRAVALAEIAEVEAALSDVDALRAHALANYLPLHAGAPICCAGQAAQRRLAPPTMPLSPSAERPPSDFGCSGRGNRFRHAEPFRPVVPKPTNVASACDTNPSFAIDPRPVAHLRSTAVESANIMSEKKRKG